MPDVVRVGVLADTHIPHQVETIPAWVLDTFRDVDLILHAGDLDEMCALDDLRPLAPCVVAVRGNLHLRFGTWSSPHLPKAIHFWIKGHHIVLNHGIPYLVRAMVYRLLGQLGTENVTLNRYLIRDQQRAFPDADLVIFGHSHRAVIERRGKTLFVNPGAPVRVGPKDKASVALLTINDEKIEAEIVSHE
jgi:putative phosphoesterase